MARKSTKTQPAISYTHKDTGEALVDVCATEAGAVVYGDSLEKAGHTGVTLVEVLPKAKGRYEIV